MVQVLQRNNALAASSTNSQLPEPQSGGICELASTRFLETAGILTFFNLARPLLSNRAQTSADWSER
jgi:hypothetical protein